MHLQNVGPVSFLAYVFMHMNVLYKNSENGVLLKSIVIFPSCNLWFFVSAWLLMLLMSVTFFGNTQMNHSKFELKFNSFNTSSIFLRKLTSSTNTIQTFLKNAFALHWMGVTYAICQRPACANFLIKI